MQGKKCIIIIDASEDRQATLQKILSPEYRLISATDGHGVKQEIEKEANTVAGVILDATQDMLMGRAFLRERMNDGDLLALPVVAIIRDDNHAQPYELMSLGVTDIISMTASATLWKHRLANAIASVLVQPMRLENEWLKRQNNTQLQMQTLINQGSGGIGLLECMSDGTTYPLFLNEGFYALFGYSSEQFKQTTYDIRKCIHPNDRTRVDEQWRKAKTVGDTFNIETRAFQADGTIIWLEIQGTRIKYDDSEFPVYIIMLTDITRLKESEDALRMRAERDALTGVYNRDTFYQMAEQRMQANPASSWYILRWNIERFKMINELYGRTIGDQVLCALVKNIQKALGEGALIGRIGSDDFVVCITGDGLDIKRITTVDFGSLSMQINYNIIVDMGVYPVEDIHLPIDQMCDRAKMALLTVKDDYMRNFAFYDNTFRDNLLKEQEILSEMEFALNNGQFCVYYQPLYGVQAGRMTSAEALVRWKHPEKGMISPGDFIPLFERNGFITRLDAYVWEEVCKFIHMRQTAGKKIVPISVNVSRKDLHAINLVHNMVDLVERYDIKPDSLKIEITESAYTDDPHQMMHVIEHFREHGFKLLMDDFGSGFSSLNMLKDMQLDILKIDMQFLKDMETSVRAANVITSVVRMAKWLDMETVAEGVETQQQLDFLRNIGCDQIQGYYFSKPLPEHEFATLLDETIITPLAGKDVLNRLDMDALLDPSEEINILLNDMIGAMGIFEMDGDSLEAIKVNKGYMELCGGQFGALIGERYNFSNFLDRMDYITLTWVCDAARTTGDIQKTEVRHHSSKDQTIWLEIKVRFIGLSGDNPLYYFAIEDITGRKELDEDLYFHQYVTVLKSIFKEIYELHYDDNTFNIIYQENGATSARGKEADLKEALEYARFNLVDPSFRKEFSVMENLESLSQRIQESPNGIYSCELKMRIELDDDYRWVRRNIVPMVDLATGGHYYLNCIEDIHETKEAESARDELKMLQTAQTERERHHQFVEQQRQQLENLYQNLPVGIVEFAVDPEIQVISINHAGLEIMRYTTEEIFLSTMNTDLQAGIHPDYRDRFDEMIAATMDGKKQAYVEIMVSRGDGSDGHVYKTMELVRGMDGRRIIRDIFIPA